jgi:hypothetical protein
MGARRSASAERDARHRGSIGETAGLEQTSAAGGDAPRTRSCAQAEAAALRWHELHDPD